ncbi:hypothetical protein L211DRAFT_898184 [Terfezia boudieri ATCC MYA-4762]|uniref:Uncharacterized protein n=1 Tax=Terfezia boudieri ATCC MYA-4762 TaxID=1051890 RepID=A0A3N4L8W4_9PEZI|nr:hypothetical protein L211DRAFT_898184 [Terfezia boudieri ATCC MYA-4762]
MDNLGKEDRVNPLHKTRLPGTDHPQPPSLADTDPDTGAFDMGALNAAMGFLTRTFNPTFQTDQTETGKEIFSQHSYHLHGLRTILEDFHKFDLFSSYYWDDAAKHHERLTKQLAPPPVPTTTNTVSTNTEAWEAVAEEERKETERQWMKEREH